METRVRSEFELDEDKIAADYRFIIGKILNDNSLADWEKNLELVNLHKAYECRCRWLVEGDESADKLLEQNGLGEYL